MGPRLFLFLCLTPTAHACGSFREFAVANCTACPTLDETRPGVQMAVCKDRVGDTGGEMAYTCACGNFPRSIEPAIRYFPKVEGNVTKCAASWAEAPELFTALTAIYVVVMVYALAHIFYIIALSRIFCCKRVSCTKNNGSALLLGVGWFSHVALKVWRIAAQGEIAVGYSNAYEHAALAYGFSFLQTIYYVCLFLAIPFYITSICDMVCPGEEWAARRRIINGTLWCLATVTALSYVVLFGALRRDAEGKRKDTAPIFGFVVTFSSILLFLVANVFMYLAYRSMREVRLLAASCGT